MFKLVDAIMCVQNMFYYHIIFLLYVSIDWIIEILVDF